MTHHIVKLNGVEVARVSGDGITCGKKNMGTPMNPKLEDDPNLLRLVIDSRTILVFYVTSAKDVTVEKEEGSV